MNTLEKEMVNILINLKENYSAVGVKAEFEAEGTRMEEAFRLKEITTRAGLDLTIKIGGCEAVKDMRDAKIIGVNAIVAPMIESVFAIKKYINLTETVFKKDEWNETKFLINIETITGVNQIDDILDSEYSKKLAGIVVGRTDLAASLNMGNSGVESEIIFDITKNIAHKTLAHGKNLIIGGGVCAHSLLFFKKLPANALTGFETRKVIFDSKGINQNDMQVGILRALEFELMWLKNKRDFYKTIYEEDAQRFDTLEARYKKLLEDAGNTYE